MAPKGKSPLRKISPLGLDQLLSQIVGQATQQGPPTGTTTTTAPPPASQPGAGGGGQFWPGTSMQAAPGVPQARPPERPTESQTLGMQAGAYPLGRPEGGVDPTTFYQTRPTESTTVGPYSRGGYPTGTPEGGVNPSTYYQTRPTESAAARGSVDPTNAAIYSAAVVAQGVGEGGSAASKPVASTYRNIGEIFAEQPPASDPQSIFNFNRERLNKIGRFYNLSDEELAQAQANVAGMLGMAVQKPGITPVETQALANQMFQAEGTRIIKANDAKAYGNNDPRMSPPPFVGTDPNAPPVMQSDENPLSVYGVYSTPQIIAIQGQIGMYTNQMQDRFSQAAGGWKPSAAMQDAYARQAQAIPAVQALEGQAALAQALAAEKEKNSYYTLLLQQRSSDASSGTGDVTDEQMNAAAEAARNGG